MQNRLEPVPGDGSDSLCFAGVVLRCMLRQDRLSTVSRGLRHAVYFGRPGTEVLELLSLCSQPCAPPFVQVHNLQHNMALVFSLAMALCWS